jgi:hypothetical protein
MIAQPAATCQWTFGVSKYAFRATLRRLHVILIPLWTNPWTKRSRRSVATKPATKFSQRLWRAAMRNPRLQLLRHWISRHGATSSLLATLCVVRYWIFAVKGSLRQQRAPAPLVGWTESAIVRILLSCCGIDLKKGRNRQEDVLSALTEPAPH